MRDGGSSLPGGIVGALVAVARVVHGRCLRFFPLMVLAAPSLPLGFAVGRAGKLVLVDHLGERTQLVRFRCPEVVDMGGTAGSSCPPGEVVRSARRVGPARRRVRSGDADRVARQAAAGPALARCCSGSRSAPAASGSTSCAVTRAASASPAANGRPWLSSGSPDSPGPAAVAAPTCHGRRPPCPSPPGAAREPAEVAP